MKAIHRPNNRCSNPHCGNTLFTKEYRSTEKGMLPIWECTNCGETQTRQTRYRMTNKLRARANWGALLDLWKPTTDALYALVDQGLPSGCLLIYAAGFSYHMEQLRTLEAPSHWDIRYHTAQAKLDLEKAKQFVEEKQNELRNQSGL